MIKLQSVSLICIDCINYGASINAIKKSMEQCRFDSVILLTDVNIKVDGIEVVLIKKLRSKQEYSRFIIKELYKYVTTDYVLIIQHDGYVINGDAFPVDLYNYDYAGALWLETDGHANGNGGCSWRSRALIDALGNDSFIQATDPEDVCICRVYRSYLEEIYGLRWATDEICDKFSFELRSPYQDTFAFHGHFHKPYKPIVVIKREAALGDVISVEPILAYFHKKGYQVVLDTLPQFEEVFYRHYFPVLFPHQVDGRQLERAIVYNLNMSYESKPMENRIRTYYEFCGIADAEIISPKLSLGFLAEGNFRLFKNSYVVIHADEMELPHRRVEGVDWEVVCDKLHSEGYDIIQVGGGRHIYLGRYALEMNTVNIMLLMYVVAGASLFIGVDSGVSHIASGFNIPSIVFFGSVNPEVVHVNFVNKICLHNHAGKGVCQEPFCYHNSITTTGQECVVDKANPPCTYFKTEQVVDAINVFIKQPL